MDIWTILTYMLSLGVVVHGDLYVHNPRGSNNRLNEKSANRNNANRMFDSQNNNRGGYNVGDATAQAAGGNAANQYQMHFFQSGPSVDLKSGQGGSYLTIEWTNQHGCGGNEDTDPQKQNCNMVLQFMCEEPGVDNLEQMRDGTNTNTIGHNKAGSLKETEQQAIARKKAVYDITKGLQESWESYDSCYMRQRNLGLFTADQNVKKNKFGYSSAAYTRQNPNGNRYAYECPEERDYFPYWHPTQWKDIAILAENSSMCSHYESKSFNIKPYHQCVELWPSGNRKHWSKWNNEQECTENSGQWILFSNYLEKAPAYKTETACVTRPGHIWAVPYDAADVTEKQCLVALQKPDCMEAPWSRSNHLGNGRGDAQPLIYTWELPHFPSGEKHKCVYRMRYNISTDDYDPYGTTAANNKKENVVSPVQDNIQLDVGGPTKLQMALNTDQTGRVFQDRSHVFYLMPRPAGWERERLFNLNSRGKRGNIVQTYPAVEYDFTPNSLNIKDTDLVHFQWTGSNTHNNQAPAGDGQAGDDGEGTGGTDRINIAQILDENENYPLPYEQTTMWQNAEVVWTAYDKTDVLPKDLALYFASSGYYRCFKKRDCAGADNANYVVETKDELQNQLNNAPASFKGAVLRFKKGIYHYMCTRNNNFTNRSNKGNLIVEQGLPKSPKERVL